MNAPRPATHADLEAVIPAAARFLVAQVSAAVALDGPDGAPVAVAGVVNVGEGKGFGFAHWTPGRKPGARGTMRLAKAAADLIRSSGREVFAVADHREPRAAALLEHIGFVHEEQDIWKWPSRCS